MNHLLFEALVRAYPFSRGKGRWVHYLLDRIHVDGYERLMRVGNLQIPLNPADENDAMYYFGAAGKAFSRLLPTLLRQGDSVVDVGANVGYFSALSCSLVGNKGRVYAIEANLELYDRLRRIAQSTAGCLHPHHEAIWSCKRQMTFHIATNSGHSSLVRNATYVLEKSISIDAVTLDEFVGREGLGKIRLLKLDIEGAEVDALTGASSALRSGCIDSILVEVEYHRMKAFGRSGKEMSMLLKGHGYEMVCTIHNEILRKPGSVVTPERWNGDYLYVRRELIQEGASDFWAQ